jgi:NAD dependent epimerase/dehydratase family enzyme
MSIVILGSTKASSQKIEDAGFVFQFSTLDSCLKNLVENK